MDEPEDNLEESVLCTHCLEPNDVDVGRCRACNAPLGSSGTWATWEMGQMKGRETGEQVDPKMHPIVFWGVWMYFGPSALMAMWVCGGTLGTLLRGEKAFSGEMAGLVFWASYGAISLWALHGVSKRYFRKESEEDA